MAPSFMRRLRQETPSWVSDGVVTAQQAETILARYPESGRWFQRPIVIFSVLRGALAGGLVLRARGHGLMGEGLFVLGGGLFLVGIALLGQIYNLAGGESDAVLLWWALLLPAAYVLPSIALIALGWLGASVWFWMFVLDRMTWLGRDIYSNGSLGAVAFGAAGVLVFALGALHGDGEFRRARQLLEQLGLLTILVAMVPLGLLRQLGAWWSSGEATRWPVAVLVLIGLAAVAVGVASFRLPHDRPVVRAGPAAALLLVLLYLLAVTLQLIHRAAA